ARASGIGDTEPREPLRTRRPRRTPAACATLLGVALSAPACDRRPEAPAAQATGERDTSPTAATAGSQPQDTATSPRPAVASALPAATAARRDEARCEVPANTHAAPGWSLVG